MNQHDRDNEMLEQLFERMFAGDLRGGVKLLEQMKFAASDRISEAVMRAKKKARPELYRSGAESPLRGEVLLDREMSAGGIGD